MDRRRARRKRAKRNRVIAYACIGILLLLCAGAIWITRLPGGRQMQVAPALADSAIPTASASAGLDASSSTKTDQSLNATNAPENSLEPDPGTTEPTAAEDEEKSENRQKQTTVSSPAPARPALPAATVEPLPLEGLTIGIDPGHQEKANLEKEEVAPGSSETKYKVSGGTQGVSTHVPEYVQVLQVGLLLKNRLESLGARVVMTRETSEVNISNQERAAICNDAGCDLVLRLHCNGAEDASARGVSLFVRKTGEGADAALAAAEAILPAMCQATGARAWGSGVYRTDTYTGLNWSIPPSILVEMGFMSNPEEDEKLCSPEYQALLVEGMARGIGDYFGRSLGEEPPAEEAAREYDWSDYVE